MRRDELLGEERDQREREEQRDEHRHGEGGRERGEELPHHPLEQAEGEEHHYRGDGRRRDGPDELLHGGAEGGEAAARGAEPQVARDVLGDDDGVVDHEADRDRHGAQGHQVERLADQPHDEHGHRERHRDRRRADGGDAPVAQEQEQHQHGEHGTDEHGVAHRADGVAYQRGLVVHPLEMDAGREARRERGDDSGHAVGDLEGGPLDLPRDVDERRGLAVARHDADVILRAHLHARHVPHPQPVRDHHAADVLGAVGLLIGHDQVLAVVLRHATDRLHGDGPPDRVGQVGVREAQRREPRRVCDHLDFAYVRALDVHAPHAGDARDQRFDLVARDVVQGGRITPLEVVRDDREQRRSESLDLDLQVRRQHPLDLAHARAHELKGVGHIGARREGDRDLARAADRLRLDARHARDHAHRLLERPRDAEDHLARAEGRALRDDLDPREQELGVDGRRQPERRPRARDGEQRDREIDDAALTPQDVEQRHRGAAAGAPEPGEGGGRATRAPSAMP